MPQALLRAAEYLPASLTLVYQVGRNIGMEKTCHFGFRSIACILDLLCFEDVIDWCPANFYSKQDAGGAELVKQILPGVEVVVSLIYGSLPRCHLNSGVVSIEINQFLQDVTLDIGVEVLSLHPVFLFHIPYQKLIITLDQLPHLAEKFHPKDEDYPHSEVRIVVGHVKIECILGQNSEISHYPFEGVLIVLS